MLISKSISGILVIGALIILLAGSGCQKKAHAPLSGHHSKTTNLRKKENRDINNCEVMEKNRTSKANRVKKENNKVVNKKKRDYVKGKPEVVLDENGKEVKIYKPRPPTGPGTKTNWSFLLIIGLALAIGAVAILFVIGLIISFVISLAFGSFALPLAILALSFVVSVIAVAVFQLFQGIRNLFRRRKIKRRKKDKDEEEEEDDGQ